MKIRESRFINVSISVVFGKVQNLIKNLFRNFRTFRNVYLQFFDILDSNKDLEKNVLS